MLVAEPGPAPMGGLAASPAEPTDSRGRRLVAVRACRRGEVLLREGPLLLWGPDSRQHVLASLAADAGGSSRSTRIKDADANKEEECHSAYRDNGDVAQCGEEEAGERLGWDYLAAFAAFRKSAPTVQDAALQLQGQDSATAKAAAAAKFMSSRCSPLLMASLGFHDNDGFDNSAKYASLAGIVTANATENSDGRRALYNALSMANHSCAPNAAWRTADAEAGIKELICITRSLAAGEEVCISYLPERELFLLGCEARRARLENSRGFVCLCERCTADEVRDDELIDLSDSLLNGGALRTMPKDKETAVWQCKELGGKLRRLDALWPAASALKASLWTSYAELLGVCGAPPALTEGAAQRALEESRPCLGDAAWAEQARRLERKLAALQRPPPPVAAAPPLPPPPAP